MFSYSQTKAVITAAFVLASYTAIASPSPVLEDVFEEVKYSKGKHTADIAMADKDAETENDLSDDKGIVDNEVKDSKLANAEALSLATDNQNADDALTNDISDEAAVVETVIAEVPADELEANIAEVAENELEADIVEVAANELEADIAEVATNELETNIAEVPANELEADIVEVAENELEADTPVVSEKEQIADVTEIATVEMEEKAIIEPHPEENSEAKVEVVASTEHSENTQDALENESSAHSKQDLLLASQTAPPPPLADSSPVATTAAKPAVAQTVLVTANNGSTMDTQQCPSSFYQVALPQDGKMCQVFAADLPASMIFFVPQSPQQVVDFYRTNNSELGATKEVKGRYLMHSEDKNMTLIISEDGQGTQVDILVKS